MSSSFELKNKMIIPKSVDDHRDQRNEEEEELSFGHASNLVMSSVLLMSLQSAIELGVFEIMAKAGKGAKLSAAEIMARITAKVTNPKAPVMVDRILRLLASHSVLNCYVIGDENTHESNAHRVYSLTSVSKHFVTNEDGVSLGPVLALIQDKVFLNSWSQLKEAILEGGIPFNRVYGMHAFEYPNTDRRFNDVFNTAMHNHSSLVIKKILESYKGFENLQKLVDVGGGLGMTLNLITSKYPHIKGTNFDLPHVIQNAPPYPGVEHVAGDMFESVPSGDAILMKKILHDWGDEQCLKLLKNCHKAIPDDGKVIVVEVILPCVQGNDSIAVRNAALGDVLMMLQNPGGKERTQRQLVALATSAGFSGIRFECFVRDFWVIELFK